MIVTHYATGPGSFVQRTLEQAQATDAIRTLLLDAAARDLLLSQRLTWQTAIRTRLEHGVADGDMPAGTSVVTVAEYMVTVLTGMAV